MRGSYLQESAIQTLCARISPLELAECILRRDVGGAGRTKSHHSGMGGDNHQEAMALEEFFELEVLPKPPKPVIAVRTIGKLPRARSEALSRSSSGWSMISGMFEFASIAMVSSIVRIAHVWKVRRLGRRARAKREPSSPKTMAPHA